MRRASLVILLAALTAAFCATTARSATKVVNRINAIGLVDYSRPPTFKVGDFVRYSVTGKAMLGAEDAYVVTLLVAGEEEWWGEKCFWLETRTNYGRKVPDVTASLISYDIFTDSLADERLQLYRRKLITGVEEGGKPAEDLTHPSDNLRTMRAPPKRPAGTDIDTLPPDTVLTPAGNFAVLRIGLHKGRATTEMHGDSTIYSESRENRLRYVTTEVPITHCAREDIDNSLARRTWGIGHSSEGSPLLVREHNSGTSRLIEIGHGMHSLLLPPERQRSFGDPHVTPSGAAKPAKPKAAGTHPSARRVPAGGTTH